MSLLLLSKSLLRPTSYNWGLQKLRITGKKLHQAVPSFLQESIDRLRCFQEKPGRIFRFPSVRSCHIKIFAWHSEICLKQVYLCKQPQDIKLVTAVVARSCCWCRKESYKTQIRSCCKLTSWHVQETQTDETLDCICLKGFEEVQACLSMNTVPLKNWI
jgi:hypothetical protein